jgi:hypothetical protein
MGGLPTKIWVLVGESPVLFWKGAVEEREKETKRRLARVAIVGRVLLEQVNLESQQAERRH